MADATLFSAIKEFDHGPFDGFLPNYVDRAHQVLAINATFVGGDPESHRASGEPATTGGRTQA